MLVACPSLAPAILSHSSSQSSLFKVLSRERQGLLFQCFFCKQPIFSLFAVPL